MRLPSSSTNLRAGSPQARARLPRGAWLNHDELSAVQGLVKYKGRWISAEEKNKHDLAEKALATQASWLSRIKMLRQAIVNGPEDRRREAESQLMTIRDPEAVGPLVRVFGTDEPPATDYPGPCPGHDFRTSIHCRTGQAIPQ